MYGTLWEQVNREKTNDLCRSPEGARVIATYVSQMEDGFWDANYLDIFLQKWDRFNRYTIYDACAFSEIHTAIALGQILLVKVHVGTVPYSDSEIEENNLALAQIGDGVYHLWDDTGILDIPPTSFSATFWGGKADADGLFAWHQPIEFSANTPENGIVHQTIDPGCIPLEIGYTNAWTSLGHLIQERGLARWPYDSKVITLCKVIDDDWCTVKFDLIDPPEPTSSLLRPRRELGRVIKPEVVMAQQLSLFE